MKVSAPRRDVAAALWLSSVQFFVVQVVVAAGWDDPPYSWRANSISDLGARSCGRFDGRFVCSPLHLLMNVSLVVLGVCMALGAILFLRHTHHARTGFALMAVAGLGAVLVGFFPEDSVFWVHTLGADLAFLLGNVALVAFGFGLPGPRWLRAYSLVSGLVALVALYLFLSHHRFFLGPGGMERLVAYPEIVWLVVFGWRSLREERRSGRVPSGTAPSVGP